MLNKVMLIGNLGKDPDFNVTPSGTPVAKFSLAVSRTTKNRSGESVKETEWFNIVAWDKLAEICEKFLHRGSKVYVEGRIQQRKYTDKENIQRTAMDIIINDMRMLDSKAESGGTGSYAGGGSSYAGSSSSYGSAPAPASSGDDFDPFLDADDLP